MKTKRQIFSFFFFSSFFSLAMATIRLCIQRFTSINNTPTRIRMNTLIAKTRSHMRQKHLSFLIRPTQNPGHERHSPTLNTLKSLQQMPFTNFLQLLLCGPRPQGHFKPLLHRIHKPGLINQFLLEFPNAKRPTHFLARFNI